MFAQEVREVQKTRKLCTLACPYRHFSEKRVCTYHGSVRLIGGIRYVSFLTIHDI